MGNYIGFKKIMVFSCFIILLINESYGQKTLPVYDGINYTVGALVYDNTNWWCLNTTPVNDVIISSGSLSFPGLLESTANKISIRGDGDDFVIWFGDQPFNTKIYYSFIFQITDMSGISSTVPAHFAGFSNSETTASSFGCSIFVQKDLSDPTKFNIGHATRSSVIPVWNSVAGVPVKYSFNTPLFIVGCYEILGTFLYGTPNDKSSFWINPSSSTFENTLPPTASLTGDLTGSDINDIDPLNRFYIRQDAASNTPSIDIDEIRIGLTWASVTPKSISTGAQDTFNERTSPTIYPNPVKDLMTIEVKSTNISFIDIYNLDGRRIMTKEVYRGTTNVDVSSIPQGSYIISFGGTGVTYSKKFIKK